MHLQGRYAISCTSDALTGRVLMRYLLHYLFAHVHRPPTCSHSKADKWPKFKRQTRGHFRYTTQFASLFPPSPESTVHVHVETSQSYTARVTPPSAVDTASPHHHAVRHRLGPLRSGLTGLFLPSCNPSHAMTCKASIALRIAHDVQHPRCNTSEEGHVQIWLLGVTCTC